MAPPKSQKGKAGQPKSTVAKMGKKKKKNVFFMKTVQPGQPSDAKLTNASVMKTSARIPLKPEEASSNWKSLCSAIKPVQSEGRKRFLQKKKAASMAVAKPSTVATDTKKEAATTDEASTIWFDDVDPILLDPQDVKVQSGGDCKTPGQNEITKILAIDCEMVGIGEDGKDSALARVSIVNHHGQCIYDKFVAPGDEVTDYRTQFSGIRPHNLKNATELGPVCHEVSSLLRGRLLVGHGLGHDLEVLMIKHPKSSIRDTSRYKPFRAISNGATPSLKRLAQHFLGIEIQSGEHSSVQDAQAAMRLYMTHRTQWENDLTARRANRKNKAITSKLEKKNKSQETVSAT